MRSSFALQLPIILLMIALAGCATTVRAPDPPAQVEVSDETWWQIDSDIVAGSLAASGAAKSLAVSQMEHWRQLIGQRTESDFIPWFSGYWAQQWMTVKVAWYKLNDEGGREPPVSKLAVYLQAQYYERVLAPVAREVDPETVIALATQLYVQRLGGYLQAIPQRHGVPQAQFDRRLQGIPAIVLTTPPASASLHQVVAARPLDSLPAYAALLRQVREAGGIAGAGLSKKRISPVAMRVSEEMMGRLAISGGTSAASALVGGVAGTVISIGAAGIGLMLHESQRGEIESELRAILDDSMDDMWLMLVDNPQTGVTAGIHRLAGQIEHSLQRTQVQPVAPIAPPSAMPLADELDLLIEAVSDADITEAPGPAVE